MRLKQLLQYCRVCSGEMETGSLRCDANISVRPAGSTELGTKTEIKNLNSFRNVERALTMEFERQRRCLERGEQITPGTLLWDQVRGQTRWMRAKEEVPDYRYFPEPDLPPLVLEPTWIAAIRTTLPELPVARRARFVRDYRLRPYEAQVLTATRELADYFESVQADLPPAEARRTASFVTTEVLGLVRGKQVAITDCPVTPAALAGLLRLRITGTLSGRLAKQVFAEMATTGAGAGEIVERGGWAQVTDAERLAAWVTEVLAAHPQQVQAYRAGKETLLGFFMGEVMRRSRGRAHPQKVAALLTRALKSERP